MNGGRIDAWMPLWIGDYLADTGRLNTEQHGAYILLIMDYWRNGAPPDDDAVLASITRLTSAQWRKHAPTIRKFFDLIDGRLIHTRIERERAKAADISTKRTAAAIQGAARRWGCQGDQHMPKGMPSGIANGMREPPQNDAQSQSQSQSSTPSLCSGVERASPQRGSRLPADWKLPDDWAEWARQERSELDPIKIAACFADYWHAQPGAKGRKTDWLATWRNWVRNERFDARSSAVQVETFRERDLRQKAERMAVLAPGVVDGSLLGESFRERDRRLAAEEAAKWSPRIAATGKTGETFRERDRRLAAEEAAKWSPRIADRSLLVEQPRTIFPEGISDVPAIDND